MKLALAINRLTAIIEQENAALTALDYIAATALLEVKRAAIADFEATAAAEPSAPNAHAIARLRAASFANATLVERAIAVQRRVIDTVLAAPRREQAPRYRADAFMARARRAVPMTLLARA